MEGKYGKTNRTSGSKMCHMEIADCKIVYKSLLSCKHCPRASEKMFNPQRTCAVRVTDYGNWVGLCVRCSTSPLVHLANDVRKIVWFSLKMLLCKGRRERIQRYASCRTFYYSTENALAYYNIRPTRSGKRPFLFLVR